MKRRFCHREGTCDRKTTFGAGCDEWDARPDCPCPDPVQDFADKLRSGANCETCVWLETEFCSTCVHLSNYAPVSDPAGSFPII